MSKSKLYEQIKRKRSKNKKQNSNKNQNKNKNNQNNITNKPHYSKNVTRKIKPLNCSPAVKGKTPVRGSCFTSDVLIKLKESFNKHHASKPILANEPVEIWKELRERLKYCPKEDCWLSEIVEEPIQAKLKKSLFTPFQPDDWKGDPNPWLSNFDIFDVLHQYEQPYPNFKILGPTPIDFDARPKDMDGTCVWEELCDFSVEKYLSNKITKIGVVFNLDEHDKDGSHWVSMFIDLEDQFIFYLDSGGEKIPKEVKALVERIIKQGLEMTPKLHIHFYENCPIEHQMGENECGMYALFFIITMLSGHVELNKSKVINANAKLPLSDGIIKKFSNYVEKINFFKDKRIPDTYVKQFRNIYFNL